MFVVSTVHFLSIWWAKAACCQYEQQKQYVSKELTSTTECRCRGLNRRPLSPWASTLPLSYLACEITTLRTSLTLGEKGYTCWRFFCWGCFLVSRCSGRSSSVTSHLCDSSVCCTASAVRFPHAACTDICCKLKSCLTLETFVWNRVRNWQS